MFVGINIMLNSEYFFKQLPQRFCLFEEGSLLGYLTTGCLPSMINLFVLF